MKKLNLKLALAVMVSLFIATLIPRAFVRSFNMSVPKEFVDSPVVLIGGLVSAFLALSLFVILSNVIFLKRIKLLQDSTQLVKNGVYDQLIQTKGNDELSALIHTFNDMQQALSSNQYLNREFVRNMSHQFKTPLTVMSSLIQTLDDKEKVKEPLLNEIDQLSSLTSTLLTLSKVDSLEHIAFKPCNASELIRRQIISKQPLWEAKGCEWQISEQDCVIQTYEPYLYEMVSNLLDNMIHYAYNQTMLKVSLKKYPNSVEMRFSNHGPALSDEEKLHVFDLFYIGDQSTGSGVGLNLVKSILERLNGNIHIESDENETTFIITLAQV